MVAIIYKKVELNEADFLYVPISAIKGDMLENGDFQSALGVVYEPIVDPVVNNGKYYSEAIEEDKLDSLYNDGELTEVEMIRKYFMDNYSDYYANVYNEDINEYDLIKFNFSNFTVEEENISFDYDESYKLHVNIPLEELLNMDEDTFPDFKKQMIELNEKVKLALKDIKKETKTSAGTISNINLKRLRKTVNKSIISQQKAVDDVTRTIITNFLSNNPKHKSHILIAGPTGTGKTEIMNIIARELNVPVFKADATAYTKEGYVGKSVYSMLEGLITAADDDIEAAQNGILIVDEIDKKLTDTTGPTGYDVLYSMLKMMDREKIELDIGGPFDARTVLFDTSNLTIVFMGAFEGLYKNKTSENKSLGFNNSIDSSNISDVKITNEDLIKYGVPSEFLGRIGTVTYTNYLDKSDMIKILTKSDISQLNLTREYLYDLGIDFKCTKGYIDEVATKTIKLGTGARGLKNIVLSTLADVYDDVLIDKKIKKITLTKDTVKDYKKYSISK